MEEEKAGSGDLWAEGFDESLDISVEDQGTFRVWLSGEGGLLGLRTSNEPIIFFFHGGGQSGLSWTLAVQELKALYRSLYIVAPDFRGHGATKTIGDSLLASDRLTEDMSLLLRVLLGGALHESPKAAAQEGGPIKILRNVVIVGHSLGGAQAIRLAFQAHRLSDIVKLCGLVVVDMVEGSALYSLPYMKSTLEQVPKHFDSIEKAVSWTVSSGMVRNPMSAAISVPPQLVKEDEGGAGGYRWRVDLLKSEEYWKGWFEGLSIQFVASECPKLLVLASWDRVDTTLMTAQMQGKFETQIINGSKHAVHEDFPAEFARILFRFLIRIKFIDDRMDAEMEKDLQAKLLKARSSLRP